MMVWQENDLPRVVVSLDTLYVRHKKEIGMLLQDNHISHYAESHYFVLKIHITKTERNWKKLSQTEPKISQIEFLDKKLDFWHSVICVYCFQIFKCEK